MSAAQRVMEALQGYMKEKAGTEGAERVASLTKDVPDYFVFSVISRNDDGYVSRPYLYATGYNDDKAGYIKDGDVGILYDKQTAADASYTWKFYSSFGAPEPEYTGLEGRHDWGDSIQKSGFNTTTVPSEIEYSNSEFSNLRDRFGTSPNTTFSSIIKDTITTLATSIDLSPIGESHNKRIYSDKRIDQIELFAISEEEAAQDISVTLTTVTGSAGVTSTSTAGGY